MRLLSVMIVYVTEHQQVLKPQNKRTRWKAKRRTLADQRKCDKAFAPVQYTSSEDSRTPLAPRHNHLLVDGCRKDIISGEGEGRTNEPLVGCGR